jgi:excisionase family DNA binding protein
MTLIDTETAASALGVTDRTVRRWVRDGTLANHGTARRIRVDLDEVMRVSDAREADVR